MGRVQPTSAPARRALAARDRAIVRSALQAADSAAPFALELDRLGKSFGREPVLHDLDLAVAAGEFVSLVGPSGCGKTTTLNLIAGFLAADSGDIRLNGKSVLSMPTNRRNLGMVFQNHALFPHLSVAENVGFGLMMRKVAKPEIRRQVAAALDLVQLADLAGKLPRELSGGQQQRVGLARALTAKPQLILLDEPLSSLDAKLRREMQVELRSLLRLVGVTAIYVTHDQEEALTLSDRIVLMQRGRIEQVGTPEEVYRHPASEFVAGFVGEISFLDGVRCTGAAPLVDIGGATPIHVAAAMAIPVRARVRLAVRPASVRLHAPAAGFEGWRGTLVSRVFVGALDRCLVDVGGGRIVQAHVPPADRLAAAAGEVVGLAVDPADWLVIGAEYAGSAA